MKIKNNTASSGIWCGHTIAAGAYYTIPTRSELLSWQETAVVLEDVVSGDLIVNDDFDDIASPSEGLAYLLRAW